MENKEKVTMTTTIRKDVLQAFKVECVKSGVAMNEVIEKAMIDYIKQQKKE